MNIIHETALMYGINPNEAGELKEIQYWIGLTFENLKAKRQEKEMKKRN